MPICILSREAGARNARTLKKENGLGESVMDANIRPVKDVDGSESVLGWLATVDTHDQQVIYAIGNTREECVEKLKRAIVFYNEDYVRKASKMK